MDTRLAILLYSQEDWDILARTVLGEARGESIEGQIAVGWSVRNRYTSKRFASTIRGVCTQPLQYSCWNQNDPNCQFIEKARISDPLFLRSLHIAGQVILGDAEDPTDGATHYVNLKIARPYWVKNQIPSAIIGDHSFYNSIK